MCDHKWGPLMVLHHPETEAETLRFYMECKVCREKRVPTVRENEKYDFYKKLPSGAWRWEWNEETGRYEE